MNDAPDQIEAEAGDYQVLARKYRPQTFADLIGQDAMVRTLTNAFDSGRLAHAFILTGVRGVGKTTTARIIARALNCVGPDGNGNSTIEPCGECEFCTAIAEDRLIDVIEMDAASRTGVDDIRELIESVRYRPVLARYKVYIIDEVHMLTRNAFNALLKTLEEPPDHVKFIFATTEIRKVPVTVLSRCQRFDLRRVDVETLAENFTRIADKENVAITDAAIALIARAADGSVRDGQSLLDQVMATGSDGAELTDTDVRDMLGLADRERTFDLFEQIMNGDISTALETLAEDYAVGADPLIQLQDLMEVVHWLTRIKVAPAIADGPMVAECDRVRGTDLSARLSMGALTRAWQMMLKGIGEVQSSPSPIQAVEMILIRLAYMADLPTPADAVKSINAAKTTGKNAPTPTAPPPSSAPPSGGGGAQALPQSAPAPQAAADQAPVLRSFEDVIALADEHGERVLRVDLVNNIHLVSFETGKIGIRLVDGASPEIRDRLQKFLLEATHDRWSVLLATEGGGETVRQREDASAVERRAEISELPMMRSIMEIFPGATIDEIKTIDGRSDLPPEPDEEDIE